MEDELTTIQIKTSTRERLKELGKKGESYDQLILFLIDNRKVAKPR